MSTIEVNKVTPVSGGTNLQIGESGDTTNLSAGSVTLPTSIITGQTEKTTLVDADKFLLSDSAASGAFKYVTKANLGGGTNTPILWAKQSAAQSVATYSDVKLAFNSAILNSGGGTFDTSNYRWTPGTAGYYQFNISVFGRTVSTTGSTYVDLYIRKNGTTAGQARYRPSTDTSQTVAFSGIVESDAADYFEVFLRYENSSTQSTDNNANLTYWVMYKIIT
jgi:hypothetical protein